MYLKSDIYLDVLVRNSTQVSGKTGNLHTDLHDSSHLHQRDELSLHTVAQPPCQLCQQSFKRPKLLQLLITDRTHQSFINFNNLTHLLCADTVYEQFILDLSDGGTSVKWRTQEQKAEEELSRVWTKPRLSWNRSATLHRFVSFSKENSTRARYSRVTTTMFMSWNTTTQSVGQDDGTGATHKH